MLKFATNNNIIDIPIYELDNKITLLDRLSSELNTLQKYLYFPDGNFDIEKLNFEEPILVEDLLNTIIERSKIKESSFSKLYNEIKNKINSKLDFKNIVELFLLQNKDFEDADIYDKKMKNSSQAVYMFYISKKIKEEILSIIINQILNIEVDINIKNVEIEKIKDIIDEIGLKSSEEILKKIEFNDNLINKIFRLLHIDVIENFKNKNKQLAKDIDKNKKNVNKDSKIFKKFDKNKGLKYTEFELNKIKFTIKLDIQNISLLEIFNNIVLTQYVPFATTNNFFKILKDFNPSPSWTYFLTKSIFLKVLQTEKYHKEYKNNIDFDNYTDAIIFLDSEEKINIQLNLISGKITKKELIRRILNILNFKDSKYSIESQEINEVNGVFYIPKLHFNNYIFYDLAMNNNLFSNILSIDESIHTTKKRSNIYIHFDHEKSGKITADITEKVLDENDIYMKNKKTMGSNSDLFSLNDNYIRIKIRKAKNMESVKYFQNIISRLFEVYNQESQNINDIYIEFIPEFLCNDMIPKTVIDKNNMICLKQEWEKNGLTKKDSPELKDWKGKTYQLFLEYINLILKPNKKESVKKIQLKDIAPEIFTSSYSRGCGVKRNPQILNDDEDAENDVMIFPKTKEEGFQRKYYCPDEKFKYPGLIENNLSNNKDKFPYVPCCFSKNQNIEGTGTKRRYYYDGEELKQSEKLQQDIWKTNKFLPNDVTGILPLDIEKIFEIANINNPEYKFYRKGMFRNKNSFLNCVLESIYVENVKENMIRGTKNFLIGDEIEARFCGSYLWLKATIISNKKIDGTYDIEYEDGIRYIQNEEEREEFLNDIRQSLSNEILAPCCRQEMYDSNVDEITESINDINTYFDPKLFLHLLEVKYNVNIFLFNRDNIKGNFITPRHIQSYYKKKNNSNCVFVFEHIGSESDNAKYPQCELIFQWDKNNQESEYSFSSESSISKNIKYIFKKLNSVYNLNTKIVNIDYDFDLKDIEVKSQIIDFYGKTRMININYKTNIISIFTTPIQPLKTIEVNSEKINKVDVEIALEMIEYLNISIINQITDENNFKIIKELYCKLGDIFININLNDSDIIEGIPIINKKIDNKLIITENKSYLVEYNDYKKLARYITEYFFWLYSKYLNEKKFNPGQKFENNIEKFVKLNIVVKSDFEYSYVPKFFSFDSGVMYKNKLVLKSEETLKRLLYVLKLMIMRDEKKIVDYHTKLTIQDFYVDITDFDYYSNQIILQGSDSILKWNKDNDKDKYFYIFNSIFLDTEVVYKNVEKNEDEEEIKIAEKIITQKYPYFFKNKLINDKIYLAQNTDSIIKAVKIALTWNNEKYNPGYDIKVESDFDISSINFILYSYINSTNILKYNVNGKDEKMNIQIIGYKTEENENMFTVLMI